MIQEKLKPGTPVRRLGKPERGLGLVVRDDENEELPDYYLIEWPPSPQHPATWRSSVHVNALIIVQ
jgi:hypothetical protein